MAGTIEARDVVKRFGRTVALEGLNLVAHGGEVTAVLGPNGAGKTTLIRAVATLHEIDGGSLRVNGIEVSEDPAAVRRTIGLAGQYAAVEPAMSGRENLEMVARLFGQSRRSARANAAAVLQRLGLEEAADRRVRTYSGGMRRKVDLGASLVGAPKLLLLDEPTTGVDPRSRLELWDAVRSLVARGTDVLLTTQYLDEADHLADRIVIVDRGRAVAAGTPAELKARVGGSVIEVHVREQIDVAAASSALERLVGGRVQTEPATCRITVAVDDEEDRLTLAVRSLADARIAVDDVSLRRPTLDEVFLALTDRGSGDDDAADAA
jgi:ABC-2 type transport system ATP-binding protein